MSDFHQAPHKLLVYVFLTIKLKMANRHDIAFLAPLNFLTQSLLPTRLRVLRTHLPLLFLSLARPSLSFVMFFYLLKRVDPNLS